MPRSTQTSHETIADWLHRLGDIDPARVRSQPPLGKATEKDFLRLYQRGERLYELVDGSLVEKGMGLAESSLAVTLGRYLKVYLDENDVGLPLGESAATRLMPGLIRIPDLSLVRWERLPERGVYPEAPILDLAPDLAVEILSRSNTPAEMRRKLKEYFLAGVQLVWLIDPRTLTVAVHTAPDVHTTLSEGDSLDGGAVLPGFTLPLRKLFVRVRRPAPEKSPRRRQSG